MTRKEISSVLRDRYGTMTRFCRLKGIRAESFRTYLAGQFKSRKFEKILADEGLKLSISRKDVA